MEADQAALVAHLERTTGLEPRALVWLINEITDFYSETVTEFVTRRHHELRRHGMRSDDVYAQIQSELATRPVRSNPLSERQLRRLVTG